MPFNHYAKIKRILESSDAGWYIKRIDEATQAKTFNGETRHFDHYYRVYDKNDVPIKYCKFQQIDRLATILSVPVESLPIAD